MTCRLIQNILNLYPKQMPNCGEDTESVLGTNSQFCIKICMASDSIPNLESFSPCFTIQIGNNYPEYFRQ